MHYSEKRSEPSKLLVNKCVFFLVLVFIGLLLNANIINPPDDWIYLEISVGEQGKMSNVLLITKWLRTALQIPIIHSFITKKK